MGVQNKGTQNTGVQGIGMQEVLKYSRSKGAANIGCGSYGI